MQHVYARMANENALEQVLLNCQVGSAKFPAMFDPASPELETWMIRMFLYEASILSEEIEQPSYERINEKILDMGMEFEEVN